MIISRTFILINDDVSKNAGAAVANLPTDGTMEVVMRPVTKIRKQTQNEAMWAGSLKDIAEQAFVEKRQYSAATWHELFKREYLPEDDDPEIESLVKDGYQKWAITAKGDKVLIGSTTQLKVRGMALYMLAVDAFGASLGVRFSVKPQDNRG